MNSLVSIILISLIVSTNAAKKTKADPNRVKKQMGASITINTADDVLNDPCHEKNYCFFMANKTVISDKDKNRPDISKNHLALTAQEATCTEDYCMRVNFKPETTNCSRYTVFMGIINKQPELPQRNAENGSTSTAAPIGKKINQWMGIGFKKASNSMFTAYGMYCRENIPGLHYGEILDKSTVEFGNKGEEFFKRNRDEQHPEEDQPSTTNPEDGTFSCSFSIPRYLEAINSEDEHIDIASGEFYILLASGIKWAADSGNLVKCDSSKPQDQCSIVEHRNWSDKHYVRGNTNAHVAKGGGWGICPPDPKIKSDGSSVGTFFFWILTFMTLFVR